MISFILKMFRMGALMAGASLYGDALDAMGLGRGARAGNQGDYLPPRYA